MNRRLKFVFYVSEQGKTLIERQQTFIEMTGDHKADQEVLNTLGIVVTRWLRSRLGLGVDPDTDLSMLENSSDPMI